jgi:hypothetical protein
LIRKIESHNGNFSVQIQKGASQFFAQNMPPLNGAGVFMALYYKYVAPSALKSQCWIARQCLPSPVRGQISVEDNRQK